MENKKILLASCSLEITKTNHGYTVEGKSKVNEDLQELADLTEEELLKLYKPVQEAFEKFSNEISEKVAKKNKGTCMNAKDFPYLKMLEEFMEYLDQKDSERMEKEESESLC